MTAWVIANAVGLVVVLVANRAFGARIGAVSRAYDTPFTPSNPAFSIWVLIYALLVVVAVAQFCDASIARDLSGWYVAQCVATIVWLLAFVRQRIRTAAVALVITTALVGVCYARTQRWRGIALERWPRAVTSVAFSIFWGWTVAAGVIGLATTVSSRRPSLVRFRAVVWMTVWVAILAVQTVALDPVLSLPLAWAAAWRATRDDSTAAVAAVGFALNSLVVRATSRASP